MTGDQETPADRHGEEVRIPSGAVTLAGTFVDVPDARAAVLLVTGSGPLDRDSNSRVIRLEVGPPFAAALSARHLASLRFDKRGVGESSGDYFSTGLADNGDDVDAAVRWLVARCPELPVFVVGLSEGALHAARLAADGEVAGAVLIGGPARRGEEILTWQAAQIVPTLPPATRALLRILHIDPLESQQKQFRRLRSTTASTLRVHGRKLNARWLREFLDHDPVPVLRRIGVPVLALAGANDMQVPPDDAAEIGRLVGSRCQVELLPGLSHILRDDPDTEGPRAYRRAVRRPVSPAVLDAVTRWLDGQIGSHDAPADAMA